MISIRPAWASQECKRNQKTYSLARLAIILDVSWRNCKWQRTRMPQSFDVKGPAGCDLVEDTIGSGPLRLFRKWTILPERFVSTSKAKSEGKNNPWHLRLYSYCINWTHYAMIGFFCWGFFQFFFQKCLSLSFRLVLWGLLYLSRLLGQMHELQLPHQECIKHWMRMGGTNQIMWAELEFILICYIP